MANGIELAPLVCDIKANLSDYNKGIDEADRKGSELERQFKELNGEAKLTESQFKLAGASAELLGNKTGILANKQNELSEKLKLQSRTIDLTKRAYEEAEHSLQEYSNKGKKLEEQLKELTEEHKKAGKAYGTNSKEVKELEQKINSLNEEYKENEGAINKATHELDEYKIKLNDAQTELLQTQRALNNTNREMEQSNISAMNEKLDKTSSRLKDVGSNLTTHVSLPLLALGGIAGKVGMDFESQMSRVKAISGATGDQFKELEDQALSLGQSTAFSAGECAEGMENLASAGFAVNEITEAMPGLLDLAASSGENLAMSSEIAAGTLRGFGLEASQTAHVADVLAKNAADTNAAVADTGEAMKYVAPVAHAMGLSFEEVTAAIGLMSNANIKGSQSGTTLRASLTRLAKPSDDAASAMENMGFKAFDSNGKLKSLSEITGELNNCTADMTDQQKEATIAQIFGQEAMSGMLVLMDAGPEKLNNLSSSFETCDGAAKDMAETMQDNTKASIEEAFGALETASIKMLQVAAPAIKNIADGIGNLADSFSALTPETQELILKLGLFTVALGPTLSLVGKGVGLFSKLTPLIAGTSAATAGAGTAAGGAAIGFGTLASAALPLVGALAAVSGGLYLLIKNSETMNSSCLKSKEDLGVVGSALKYLNGDISLTTDQMDKMNIKHKEWSDKISPETQKALTETSNKIANLNFELEHSNGLDGVITKGQIEGLKKRTDELFNETIEKIKARTPEAQKAMADSFKADDGTLDKNEKKLMEFFNKSQDKQIKEVKGYQDKINKIYATASKENRDLKQSEIKTIQDLTIKMGQVSLSNTVKNNQELLAAQSDFNARMKSLDMKGVSSLLSEKAKARDKEIKSIRLNYDKQIEELKLYRPKMNAEQQKACDDQIKKLEKLKTDSVGNEKKKYQGFLDEAMKKYPELIDYIDTSNGKVMTNEEKSNYKRLTRFGEHMQGMMGITKTGYYQIYSETDKQMHNCYVEVDEQSGRIVSAWDKSTGLIYGNPIKAQEKIDEELKNGQKFAPIAKGYHDKAKQKIWDDSIKVQCEKDWDLFGWVKSAWSGVLGWFSGNPVSPSVSRGGARGSHYNGLDNVPYDGYLARLHKNERVLTADENAKYTNRSNEKTIINFNGNYGFKDKNDIDYFMNQAAIKLKGVR